MTPDVPVISYIVTCRNRPRELVGLLNSISQTKGDFTNQIIVCAQSPNIYELVRVHYPNVILVPIPPSPLSVARNIGLRYATGNYVCFPDDDCYFDAVAILIAVQELEISPNLDFVAGIVRDPETHNTWHGLTSVKRITYWNVWRGVISFNFLVKAAVVEEVGAFDELFGVGSVFGAGEETDYVIRILQSGYIGVSNPRLVVFHKDKEIPAERAYAYGQGTGALYRKHLRGPGTIIFFIKAVLAILTPLVRCILHSKRMNLHWYTFLGRARGFFRWGVSSRMNRKTESHS